MPRKNGLEVLQEVQSFYDSEKQRLARQGLTLVEPEYVFLTAYMSIQFKKHLQSKGVKKIYEKPLVDRQLLEIINQLDQ